MADLKKLKGIVFDKDGVLVDFDRTWIKMLLDMAEEIAEGNRLIVTRLLDIAGYDAVANSIVSGSIWAAGHTDDLVAAWNDILPGWDEMRLRTFINRRCINCEIVPLFPVAKFQELFRGLSARGFQLGLTTNDVEASAKKTMDAFGLSPFLSLIVGYDSIENPKPAADPVMAFCSHCELVPEQIAVVGDNVHDMEMARSAGALLRVGVLSGNSSKAELRPYADHLIDDVMELPQLLKSENGENNVL